MGKVFAKVFATPKAGVLVRHENGKALEAKGEAVERNSYWLRRRNDGDVTLTDLPAAATTTVATEDPAVPAKKAGKS